MVPFEMQVLHNCMQGSAVVGIARECDIDRDKSDSDEEEFKNRLSQFVSFADVMSDILDDERCDVLIDYMKSMSPADFDKLISSDKKYGELFVEFLKKKQQILVDDDISSVVDCRTSLPKFKQCDKELFNVIGTEPTDRFIFDESVRDFLQDKCIEFDPFFVSIQHIIDDRFPVKDCEISVKKEMTTFDGSKETVEFVSRVYIHESVSYDWVHREVDEKMDAENLYHIGYLDIRIPKLENTGILVALIAFKGYDNLLYFPTVMPYGFEGYADELFDFYNVSTQEVTSLITKHLQTWFTVEWFCMICPDLLKDGRRVKDRRKRISGKKLTSATRRINYHYWTKESMEKIMTDYLIKVEDKKGAVNDEKRA